MVLSSAIVCDRDRTIADDRRPYCDLRSAIIWKPAFRGLCCVASNKDMRTWHKQNERDLYGVIFPLKFDFRFLWESPKRTRLYCISFGRPSRIRFITYGSKISRHVFASYGLQLTNHGKSSLLCCYGSAK